MTARRVVLGPDSASMLACERIARECEVVNAKTDEYWKWQRWKRVTPETAYRADWPEPKAGDVWVGCQHRHSGLWDVTRYAEGFVVHKPSGATLLLSDPSAPPALFLPASSVGRLLVALHGDVFGDGWEWIGAHDRWMLHTKSGRRGDVKRGSDAIHAAASEHWRDAALRGDCPGVDPVAFREWEGRNEREN